MPRRSFLQSFSLLALAAALPGAGQGKPADPPPDRQVYADFTATRFTRQHDGTNGLWQFAGRAAGSRLRDTNVSYNADLVDANGRQEIAATAYPLAGVQSDLDPDYLEYQVLSAKLAHIDGFMVEWGFPGHQGNNALLALIPIAQKYGLKVGVNWCVSWVSQAMPAGHDRESYLRRLDDAADYILRKLYTAPNAAHFGGRPVVMVFGGDLNEAEFRRLANHRNAAAGGDPLFLRQRVIAGGLADGRMVMNAAKTDWYDPAGGFAPEVGGFFGWVPTRLRHTTGPDAQWDREGTVGDAVDYLKMLLSLPASARPFLRMSSASPGFDNRPSAGWNKNDLSHIPRDDLAAYDAMWRFDIAHQARFDWLLIPTWNDWTESTQIQPSVEDRGAALALTEWRAAAFKDIASRPDGLSLPLRLFRLRKGWGRVARIGGVPSPLDAALNAIARAIADRAFDRASRLIATAERELAAANAKLPKPRLIVLRAGAAGGLSQTRSGDRALLFALPSTVLRQLRGNAYDAELAFDYRSDARSDLTVTTATDRKPSAVGDYSVVAKIRVEPGPIWRPARVRVFAENAAFDHRLPGGNDLRFAFSQPAEARNVTLKFAVYARAEAPRSPGSR